MSSTGLEVFDKTVQTTNIWLNEISADLGPDRHVAWHVLGAVLRALRDRLPIDLAAHLGAELPILVRGTYYDQWRPQTAPEKSRHLDDFLQRVSDGLSDTRPVNVQDAVSAVFRVLSRHVAPGQIAKVRDALPQEVRSLWQPVPAL